MSFLWTHQIKDKQKLTGYVTRVVHNFLFIKHLTRRGAQSYLISVFFDKFTPTLAKLIEENPNVDPHDLADRILSNLNFKPTTTDDSAK